jgi:sugar/nucleoside kinase (ribokinase family)
VLSVRPLKGSGPTDLGNAGCAVGLATSRNLIVLMVREYPQFDLLGFGAVAVDELLLIDEYPPAESKVRVRDREQQCGGLTGTALVAAARLGARCAYVGVIGDDELSQVVLNRLAIEGVELAHAVRRSGATPAHSTILVDRRNHTRTIFASAAGQLGADPREPDPGLIQAACCILVDHHGGEGSLRAARIIHEPSAARPQFGHLLRQTIRSLTYVFINTRRRDRTVFLAATSTYDLSRRSS